MTSYRYLLLLVGMGIVTYGPRWIPLVALANRPLPRWLREWLDLVPAAILGALVAPALMVGGEPRQLDLSRPELLVALPTLAFAWRTRSLGGTVIVGMALYWILGPAP